MTFYWQLDTKGIQWIQYAGIIGALCGVPLALAAFRVASDAIKAYEAEHSSS